MATTQIDGGRQIKAGTITNTEIATGAAIALSKLAEAVIQADGGQAFTADQSMGGFKLTSVATPTTGTDAANKSYVDGLSQGIDWKNSVRAATTVTGTLATAYENGDVIDSVTLATGDRILIKNQTAGEENGIYVVAASGSPTRSTDADSSADVTAGFAVFVEEGGQADTGWVVTNDGAITLGTTALAFSQFTGLGQVTAGAGLTKTGGTIDVIGTTNRITVSADAVDIGSDVVTLTDTQTLTNKTLTTPTIGSFTNAGHNHTDAAGGGQITDAALSAAVTVPKGGTGRTSNTAYAIMAGGTTTTSAQQQVSGLGTSGQVLTSAGAGALPTWEDASETTLFATRETPTGLVNGSNVTYTLANTPTAGSEEVFLNGVLQEPGAGNDYTISSATITYLAAPLTGDKIRVNYRY